MKKEMEFIPTVDIDLDNIVDVSSIFKFIFLSRYM